MSAGKLQRRSHILHYHRTREVQVEGIIKFVHMNCNYNPVYIVTKSRKSNTWFYLTKSLLFWYDMDFLKD